MKRFKIGLCVTAAMLGGYLLISQAADVVSQNVVGFFKITIPGATRAIIAVPMQKIPVYRGVITANDAVTNLSLEVYFAFIT